MSKADEMFEELGYCNKNQVFTERIQYEKTDESIHNIEYIIVFNFEYKEVLKVKYDWENDKEYVSEISIPELQAINEFCKEKGWLDVK